MVWGMTCLHSYLHAFQTQTFATITVMTIMMSIGGILVAFLTIWFNSSSPFSASCCCLLLVACCLLFVVCCLLFVVCCLVVGCWLSHPFITIHHSTSNLRHIELKGTSTMQRCMTSATWIREELKFSNVLFWGCFLT